MDVLVAAPDTGKVKKAKDGDRYKDAPYDCFPVFGDNGYHEHAAHDNAHSGACAGNSHAVEPAECYEKEIKPFPFCFYKEGGNGENY